MMRKTRKQIAAELQAGRSGAHKLAAMAVAFPGVAVRVGYYTGTGRHTRAVDLSGCVCGLLDRYGILHEKGNDASRGGVLGAWVRVLNPRTRAYRDLKARIAAQAAARAAHDADMLRGRVEQVAAHLRGRPVPVVTWKGMPSCTETLYRTDLAEGYAGCGKGTAYVADGHVIAWHYGYRMPERWAAPGGAEAVRIMLSCTQIVF